MLTWPYASLLVPNLVWRLYSCCYHGIVISVKSQRFTKFIGALQEQIALSPTTVRMVVLSSPRRCIRFSHTADHCHSLVVVQNVQDEPPKSAVASGHASCRASVWLSRGFRRLVALLLSLPPGSLYPGLPQSSLLSGTPQLSLLQELSTAAIRVHCGDSDLSLGPFL